jgi:hypothetical protein
VVRNGKLVGDCRVWLLYPTSGRLGGYFMCIDVVPPHVDGSHSLCPLSWVVLSWKITSRLGRFPVIADQGCWRFNNHPASWMRILTIKRHGFGGEDCARRSKGDFDNKTGRSIFYIRMQLVPGPQVCVRVRRLSLGIVGGTWRLCPESRYHFTTCIADQYKNTNATKTVPCGIESVGDQVFLYGGVQSCVGELLKPVTSESVSPSPIDVSCILSS